MKENTKCILKQINRLLKIGVLTFAWLMACVGVTAYSVYWLRQNANYEQEAVKREIKPKNANPNVATFDYVFRIKSQTFLQTYLSYENNTNDYKSYFDMDYDNWPVDDTNPYLRYRVEGNFGIRVSGRLTTYNRMQITMTYNAGTRELHLSSIYVYVQGDSSSYFYMYSGNTYYANLTLLVGGLTGVSYSHMVEYRTYGCLNFYFDKVFDYSSSYSFNFNDIPNYTQLLTYQVLPNNVFKYNGDTPVTPVDIFYDINVTFESNGQLFDAVRLYCSAVGYTADNNGNITEYDNYLSSSTSDYYLTLTAIEYCNYNSNTAIQVASLGVLEYKSTYKGQNGSFPVYLTLNGFNWIDNNYKYLSIASNSIDNNNEVSINYINASVCPLLNLKSYQALTFDIADTIIGNNITDIGLSNVFTLMSSAFNGLAGLMAIQVIPGITIGLLCFIPLIVTIIIVVLRLVKK